MMRVAALVLGIIGGVAGILVAAFLLLLGDAGSYLPESKYVMAGGIVFLVVGILGLVGAAISGQKPKAGSALLVIAAGLSLLPFGIGAYSLLTGPLFLVAAIVSLVAGGSAKRARDGKSILPTG